MREIGFPGDELRERREELGLSLAEAHSRVHVPMQHLHALERGDLGLLPPPAYTIGFIQSYCEFLELRPERFIDRYRMLTQVVKPRQAEAAAPRAAAAPRSFSLPSLPSANPRWVSEMATWGAICGVLLLGWLTWSALIQPIAAEQETRIEAGSIEVEYPEYHFLDEGY